MMGESLSEVEIDSFDLDDTPRKDHDSVSPAGGAESLFLAGIATSHISRDALSNSLRKASRYPRSIEPQQRSTSAASVRSALTVDDFQSCHSFDNVSTDLDADVDTHTLDPQLTDDEQDDNTAFFSLFSPVKKSRSSTISNTTPIKSHTMAKKSKSKAATMSTPVTSEPKTDTSVPEPSAHDGIDVAEPLYEKAKNFWSWGKGVPVVSLGFGITESIVGKAVSVVGTDFEKLDHDIQPHLANLDAEVINPAIQAVIGVVLGAAGKTEEIVKPIVIKVLSPFGLIKNEAENPELTK